MKTVRQSLLALALTISLAACGTSITGPHNPDPGQHNPVQRHGVSRPQKRTHIVETADIMQHHADREPPHPTVGLGDRGRFIRRAF